MNKTVGQGKKDGKGEYWWIDLDALEEAIEENPALVFHTEYYDGKPMRAVKVNPKLIRKTSNISYIQVIDFKGKVKK